MTQRICSAPECSAPHYGRGFCESHYRFWRRYGSWKAPTVEERFWQLVNKTETCWLWLGGQSNGYGEFGRRRKAHRFAYELLVGPIPDGMELDHRATCPRVCVNPAHLRPVTHKQNLENLAGAHSNSRTGIRGVSYRPDQRKFRVQVKHDGKCYPGGYFVQLADAEVAAIALRNHLFTHNDVDR